MMNCSHNKASFSLVSLMTMITTMALPKKPLEIIVLCITLLGVLTICEASSRELLSDEPTSPMNISQKFEQWMAKYQRVYSNSSEKEKRFAIFRNNLKNINIFNSRGAENFTQRINLFGDLTDEEFRSRYLGSFHIPNTATTSSSFFKYQSIKDEDLSDATVDWRRDGVVTNVKNQGECVSSWAFATVAALEGIAPYIKDNKFMNLSAQQLIDCSKSFGTHGCTGGLPSDALAYVAAKGLVSENRYPYQGIEKQCDSSLESSPELGIHAFSTVPPNDEKAVANVVYNQPVIVIHSVSKAFQYYGGGIFRDADGSCENSTLSHATTVIGYGTTIRGVDYWILKNSWGEDWGENGYMRILRNPENKPAGVCNLAISPVYPSLS